jgi:hypothetical protein
MKFHSRCRNLQKMIRARARVNEAKCKPCEFQDFYLQESCGTKLASPYAAASTELQWEIQMVKRTATIVVFLLAISLTAFAGDNSLTGIGSNTAGGVYVVPHDLTPQSGSHRTAYSARGVEPSLSQSSQLTIIPEHGRPQPGPYKVPEPASVLVLGTGLLLGFRILKRKRSFC